MGEKRGGACARVDVMKFLALGALLLVSACATAVSHPTKTTAEMQTDIKLCSDEANRKFWMDSIAALYNAYDCLEGKGYKREEPALGAGLDRTLGAAPKPKPGPVQPCRVPCRKGG